MGEAMPEGNNWDTMWVLVSSQMGFTPQKSGMAKTQSELCAFYLQVLCDG